MRGNKFGHQYQFPSPHHTTPQQQHLQQQPLHPQPQHQLSHFQRQHLSHKTKELSTTLQPTTPIYPHSNLTTFSPFLIENFEKPSFSGYQKRAGYILTHGKRKCDSDNTFHPRTKQQITEERITSSMQQLSLEINQRPENRYSFNQPSLSNRTIDEGFFEEVHHSSSDDELDVENGESPLWAGSKFKQIYFTAGIKESLKKFDEDILPQQILHEMHRSSLALVPYKPPVELANIILGTKHDKFDVLYQTNVAVPSKQKFDVKSEMDVDEEEPS